MDLPVQAIAEYQEAVNFRFALWVEFMCGRLEARHVPRWPEHPVFPRRVPPGASGGLDLSALCARSPRRLQSDLQEPS